MSKAEIEKAARALPVNERYELAHSLLASVSSADELTVVPVHDWQRGAVREALSGADERTGALLPSEDVEEEIERDLSR